MSKDVYVVVRGVLDYAKLVGAPRPHTGLPKYDKGPYWSVDITPDEASRAKIEAAGFSEKLKELKKPDDRRAGKGSFLSLRHLELKKDGSKNKPPVVKDVTGKVWDERLLGNGTVADIKVKVVDYGPGSEKGVYYQVARILKLVPYERDDFEELSEDDEYFASAEDDFSGENEPQTGASAAATPEDLNDDVPY